MRKLFAVLAVLVAVSAGRAQIKPTINDTITLSAYADNWCAVFVNGRLVAVDPIDFLPHNVVSIDLLPEYPMTIAVMAKDNADPRTGMEYGNHIGDGDFILKFADGTVTDQYPFFEEFEKVHGYPFGKKEKGSGMSAKPFVCLGGATCRNRTGDLLITNQLLYRLS